MKYLLKGGRLVLFESWRSINKCALSALEARKARHESIVSPPIFIVGAPRSGSTLTMQVLVSAFAMGYISNLECGAFGHPSMAGPLRSLVSNFSTKSQFESDHGRTKGLLEPSECGEWWYRFFPRKPAYTLASDMPREQLQEFAHSIALMEASLGSPMLFKNLFAGVRIEPILRTIPRARFVLVRRDILANALSILAARTRNGVSLHQWWSVPPPGFERFLGETTAVQAVAQIRLIERLVTDDLERLGALSQLHHIQYENLCKNPASELERFEEFANKLGSTVLRTGKIPPAFPISEPQNSPHFDEVVAAVPYVDSILATW